MLSLTTKLLLISFTTLAVLHGIGLYYQLYWVIAWYDIPMHFFGGVIVALGFFSLRDLHFPVPQRVFQFPYFMLCVLSVAVAWEVFEYGIASALPADYVLDTAMDLGLGLLGGWLGYTIGTRLHSLDI